MIIIWLQCPADEVILCRVRRVQESLRWNDSVTESVTTQPCQAVCCCVSVVVCLFVCLFAQWLLNSSTQTWSIWTWAELCCAAGRTCLLSVSSWITWRICSSGRCVCVCVWVCMCVCVCVLSEHFFLSDCLSVTTGCGCLLTSLLTFRRSAASEFSPSTAVTSPGRRYAGHVFIVRIRPESLLLLFNCRKRLYPFIYFKSF